MVDVHALSGAYAVHGLADDERAEFEQHLAVCPACREEVAGLQEAAASLAELQGQGEKVRACGLAIVDINLGRNQPTGVDVYEWLRKEGFVGRVVFLTGHGEDDARVRAASEIDGTRLLTKPIDFAEFVRLVEETG